MMVRATDLKIGDKILIYPESPLVEVTYMYRASQNPPTTQSVLCSDGIERKFLGSQFLQLTFRKPE